MDSTRLINVVNAGDGESDKIIQDNRLDAGYREEIDDNASKLLIMEIYPWIQQFRKMCRTSLFQPSMTSLKHLMMYYTRNVRLSVNECYTKPLRAEKLKDSISESLLFFLYYYREITEDHDRVSYMDIMTDLLAMYIDMELKASKKGREHNTTIAARLSLCLHVYLEHSAEHLLDTLLKVHFMTNNYQEILDPVITKIFEGIEEHPTTSVMYVRYFLVFRLWKKLNKDIALRNQINVSALASLGPMPSDIHPFIIESVLPKVPKLQKLSTKLLLLNKFDVDKCCEEFLKFCKRDRILNTSKGEQITCPTNNQPSAVPEDTDSRVSIVHNNIVNVSIESQVNFSSVNLSIDKIKTIKKTTSFTKGVSSHKLSSSRKSKKTNDIVFIDLTSDNVTEKVLKQKKTRRKLIWLEAARKRINSKAVTKKCDLSLEDSKVTVQPLEDTVNLDSLSIDSPRCRESPEMIIPEDSSAEEPTTSEELALSVTEVCEQRLKKLDIATTCNIKNLDDHLNLNDCNEPMILECIKDSVKTKNPIERVTVPEIASNKPKILSIETKSTVDVTIDYRKTDDCSTGNIEINDKTNESISSNVTIVRDVELGSLAKLDTTKSIEARPEFIPVSIKANHMGDEIYEIIKEEVVSSVIDVPIIDTVSRLSLEIGCNEVVDKTIISPKLRETEFQDSIDGLSLLASVSQRVSHLTTTTNIPQTNKIQPTNGELIKVKNYASLVNTSAIDEIVTSSDTLAPSFCSVNTSNAEIVNRIVDIYPEDAMGKVAYQVEVTSTGDIDSYTNNSNETLNNVVAFQTVTDDTCRNNQTIITSGVNVESTTQAEKDDTNVILNGETVVLFQKSPNSNLYIINKAVENKDHDDGGLRDISEHANEVFGYETVYRNQSSMAYDIPQYNRDVSVHESRRVKKVVAGVDSVGEANRMGDTMDLTKTGKNIVLPMDVIGKGTKDKRKNASNSTLNRRRRIKQEYNGCDNNLSGHIATNYNIQECSKERVESSRSAIHIPVTHSNPLSSIYTTYTGGAELYLPCHKNYNSMTCGLTVNAKNTTGGKAHCSCLNCTYGIVAHCTECILPSNETRSNSIDNSPYYLPIHSTVQSSAVQDCGVQDSLGKIFDDQLVCKLEQSILSNKPLDNVAVKYEPKVIYRAELDNKLPLKKRFKAMMSGAFEISIKREKAESYPGTPMISIAALDSQEATRNGCIEGLNSNNNSIDLSMQERCETHNTEATHHTNEMIRRDYHRKDMMMMSSPSSTTLNGYRSRSNGSGSNGERKRKRRTTPHENLPCNGDDIEHNGDYQKICKTIKHKETNSINCVTSKRSIASNKSQTRPTEKLKEPETVMIKKSTRQTRSSKRNVPKVNYIYTDGDTDWNPSGGGAAKRKRNNNSNNKKISR